MKRLALLCTLLALTALTADGFAAKGGDQTLKGEYYWVGDRSHGDLRAVFTESGQNQWQVAFYFEFSDGPHTYEGTATGNLSDGTLQGEVKNENQRRTFTFEGSFENGIFKGTHAEIRRGRASHMGTLTLRR